MNNFKLLIAAVAALIISGCESDATSNLEESIVDVTPAAVGATTPYAKFDPSNGVIPFPNNLLFAGTADLTLNIPVDDATNFADPAVAMNALDGFSTVAPMTAEFSTSIDSTSISGTSVKLYEVSLYSSVSQPIAGPVIGVTNTLTFGVDYIAALSSVDTSNSTLAIVPKKPLAPSTSYMVVITDDLKTTDGKAFGPSVTYRLIKSLSSPLVFCPDPTAATCTLPGALRSLSETTLASFEGMRQIINTSNSTVATADATISASDIILSWSFTTQSVSDVLTTVRSLVGTPASANFSAIPDLGEAGGGTSPAGLANLYQGELTVPYYLAQTVDNPLAPLNTPWQAENAYPPGGERNLTAANPLPTLVGSLDIPILVSIPSSGGAAGTVIFQHGITRDRTDMLAVADTFAAVDMSVVAIDMPLHGVRPGTGFYMTGKERTFDIDFFTEDADDNTTAQVPDGTADSTGKHFVNLQNLLVLRDNLRQAVADLFALTASIPGVDVDGGGADLNSSDIYFVGHSLGATVGTTFLGLEDGVKDAVLAFGGTSLAKVMDGSSVFSPQIVNGLAVAVGISKGTSDYELFVNAAQTVIDSADPVNYSADAAENRGILFFEVVGGDSSPSDLFVPNRVPDNNDTSTGTGPTIAAPLAGSEPMIALMGLDPVDDSQALGASDLDIVVRFTAGDHRSFLSDNPSLVTYASTPVTNNIRAGMSSFLAYQGMGLTLSDTTVVQAVP